MIETVVIATDGSASVARAVTVALDLADRFGAAVHALYVIDPDRVEELPADVQDDVRAALDRDARDALGDVRDAATHSITTARREGRPAREIVAYAGEVGADMVATGTRGRGGEHSFVLGSVAEEVVRTAPMPVLTVRRPEDT